MSAAVTTAARTFLFTDLESSTSRWLEDEPGMASALRDHDAAMRDAVERHGGRFLKHTGDGILATFDDPLAAVTAAISAQRLLRSDGRLKARMGLHLGPAEERDGDYFGPTLNRAARIMSAAHGGQVIASLSVVAAIDRSVEVRDLGFHRLKDLPDPEHLFQVVVDDRDAYPPVRSTEAFDQNLPPQRTPLIGRENHVAEVRALLSAGRLVTLTGVGGIGKTRLAIEVARQELIDHDGAVFVDLAPVADASSVVPAVANALRLRQGDASDLGALLPVFADRSMVVVLDNCEHLLDASAELAETLLDSTDRTVILATTREPLGVDGERVWRVPSLEPGASAVELFVDRARAIGVEIGETEVGEVRHICERLDGIPLAIELAAARAGHLSVAEIAGRLTERFRLLTGGRRRLQERHQTLQAALDWSYDLLDEDERLALRRSAVFVGGFTLDALDDITGQDLSQPTLDVLASLVDKSLVAVRADEQAGRRFTLLETVRLYGIDRLVEARELEDVRSRHARWVARWTEQWLLPDGGVPLWVDRSDKLGTESDNILAALEWSDEQGDLRTVGRITSASMSALAFNGAFEESRRYVGREDIEHSLGDVERARYVLAGAIAAMAAGDFLREAELAEVARTLTDNEGLRRSADLLRANGWSVWDPSRSIEIYDALLAANASASDEEYALLLYRSTDPLLMTGRVEEAAERLDRAVPFGGTVVFDYGFAHLLLGRFEEVRKALETWAYPVAAHSYRGPLLAGLLAAMEDDFDSARGFLDRAAEMVGRYPVALVDREVITAYGALAHHGGDHRHAAFLLAVAGQPPAYGRTPSLYAVHMHYRAKVREHLSSEDVREIRARAAGSRPLDVLAAERQRQRELG